MKVVFLDIDGVLNSLAWLVSRRARPGHREAIDPLAVLLLNQITDTTGASVVIVSSWRTLGSPLALVEVLQAAGVTACIHGVAPSLSRWTWPYRVATRLEEIEAWLGEHADVDVFVILDDEHDYGGLEARRVRTDPALGLTAADVSRAINR